MIHFRQSKSWLAACAFALAVAACSGDGGGEFEDLVVTQPTGSAETTAAKACTVEEVEDEYGFVVEIETCEGDADADAAPTEFAKAATIDEYRRSVAARTLVVAIRDRLVVQSGCDPARVPDIIIDVRPETLRAAVAALPTDELIGLVTEAFTALGAANAVCTSDLAAWEAETNRALDLLDQFTAALEA